MHRVRGKIKCPHKQNKLRQVYRLPSLALSTQTIRRSLTIKYLLPVDQHQALNTQDIKVPSNFQAMLRLCTMHVKSHHCPGANNSRDVSLWKRGNYFLIISCTIPLVHLTFWAPHNHGLPLHYNLHEITPSP